MLASLISIMLIMQAINAQEQYALAAEDRCFNAKIFTTGYEFSPPFDGEIIGIQLKHKSGVVTCGAHAPDSFWGCVPYPMQIHIGIVKHDVPAILFYPTNTTDGVSGITLSPVLDCVCVRYYFLSGYDGKSEIIELRDSDHLKQVSTSDTFSIQYGEGCCGHSDFDNSGTACADVYFIYSTLSSEPTSNPSGSTLSPSNDPTQPPSGIPTPAPSQHPSASPSSNPTLAPSQQPSASPSRHPTLSPSVDPNQSPSNPTLAPSQRTSVSPTLYPIALTDISNDTHTTNYTISIEIISCKNEEGGGEDDEDTTCSLNPEDIRALEDGVESATKEILVASGVVHIVGYEIIDNEVVVRLSVTLDSDANALESDEIGFHIEREISDMEKFGDVNVERTDTQEVVEDDDTFPLQHLLYNPLVMGSVLGFALFVLICCLSVGIFCVCNKKKVSDAIQQMAADQVGSTEAIEPNQDSKETDGHKPNDMDTAGIISFPNKLMVELEAKHVAPAIDMRESDASDEDLYDAEDAEPVWKTTNSPGGDEGNRVTQTRGNATNKGENGERDGATRMAPPPVPNVLHTPPAPHVVHKAPPLMPPPVPQNFLHMVIDHANNEEVGITEEGNKGDVDIVKGYRDKYGTDPQNVTQLMKFSKTDERYKALSYKEAKSILNKSSCATKGATK